MATETGICGLCTKHKLFVVGRVYATDLGRKEKRRVYARRNMVIGEKAALF
jgi:hypothetical protein